MATRFFIGMTLLCLSTITLAQEDSSLTAEQEEYRAWAQGIWDSLDRKTGEIKIEKAGAILKVPENFYYLNAADTEKVLSEVWGNPPGQPTLGMLFPAGMTPFDDDSWAVTIEYEEDGYVSDKDANDIDYDELLTQMKKDTAASSQARIDAGYEGIELVGWAAKPRYDSSQKKLHWAQEIRFDGQSTNTLNYNIRVLGRKGVLVLNFIAGIEQKPLIEANIDTVLALAEFDQGFQYSDFDADIDTVAAYGIGALVAGKLAVKAGFIAPALIFLKKFGVLLLIGVAVLWKKIFGGKKTEQTTE